jgi:hypothetical protein
MIISHEFYLTGLFADIATTSAKALGAATASAVTAIEESSLSPKQRREFTEQLKDAVTSRICELLKQTNYEQMRSIEDTIKWILDKRVDERHVLQLIAVLEATAARPLASSVCDIYTCDDQGRELYPDDAAWRLLTDETAFPNAQLDADDNDDDENPRWLSFVSNSEWGMEQVYVESDTSGVRFLPPLVGVSSVRRLMEEKGYLLGAFCFSMNPESCASLLTAGPWNYQTIIPRANIGLFIGLSKKTTFHQREDSSWLLERVTVGLYGTDVAEESIFGDYGRSELNLTVELSGNAVRILTE